jgi:SRSO17 transposase
VEKALQRSIPFRAVVADSFYGEDEGFKQSLSEQGVGYVMALKPSHTWWHRVGEIGSPWEAAVAACPWLERLPVRSDLAIRRHWQLVCVAFSFCW